MRKCISCKEHFEGETLINYRTRKFGQGEYCFDCYGKARLESGPRILSSRGSYLRGRLFFPTTAQMTKRFRVHPGWYRLTRGN